VRIKSLHNTRLYLNLDLIFLGIISAGISLFQVRADLVLIISWLIVVISVLICKRSASFIHLIISTCIAFLWVYSARDYYGYNHSYYSVAGINLYPLTAWSLGLYGVSEILNHFDLEKKLVRLLIFTLFFWTTLILFETYAFHVIKIRNISTGIDTGLPFCNCIHAPLWMHIIYFSIGPVYYIITIYADRFLKNILAKYRTCPG
jgi:hypothetical protein